MRNYEPKIELLRTIKEHPGLNQTELSERLGARQATISKWVRGFAADAWISKPGHGWRITEKGEEWLNLLQTDFDTAWRLLAWH
jgi:predicted transcriptional regulator